MSAGFLLAADVFIVHQLYKNPSEWFQLLLKCYSYIYCYSYHPWCVHVVLSCTQSQCLSLSHMEVLPGGPWAEHFCLLWLWRVKWRTKTRRKRSPQQSWSLSLSLEVEPQAKNNSRDVTTAMTTNNLPSLVMTVHIVHLCVFDCNATSVSREMLFSVDLMLLLSCFTCKGVYALSFALMLWHSWQRQAPLKTNTFIQRFI